MHSRNAETSAHLEGHLCKHAADWQLNQFAGNKKKVQPWKVAFLRNELQVSAAKQATVDCNGGSLGRPNGSNVLFAFAHAFLAE